MVLSLDTRQHAPQRLEDACNQQGRAEQGRGRAGGAGQGRAGQGQGRAGQWQGQGRAGWLSGIKVTAKCTHAA